MAMYVRSLVDMPGPDDGESPSSCGSFSGGAGIESTDATSDVSDAAWSGRPACFWFGANVRQTLSRLCPAAMDKLISEYHGGLSHNFVRLPRIGRRGIANHTVQY